METESVQVLWVKMKSYLNSVGPLTLYRLWPCHTHKEKVMWRWRQGAGWCVYKPRKHKACQQTHRSQGREESRHSLGSHREPTLPATWSCTSRSTTVTITFSDLDQTRRNQDRPPNKTPLPPKQHKHRKGRFLRTRRFCKRIKGCRRRTAPFRGWSSVRMPSAVDQCGPGHASSWWASPPCLLTSLTFETSAAFKVLIHFSSNQGHLSWEEKRALLQEIRDSSLPARSGVMVLGETARRSSWQRHRIPRDGDRWTTPGAPRGSCYTDFRVRGPEPRL